MSTESPEAQGQKPTILPYDKELHFEELNSWFLARDAGSPLVPETLPKVGFIIPGKAAGFLYQTDSNIAWIENLVAAPGLGKKERSELIDAIVLAVAAEARRRGFAALVGFTELDAVKERAERLGFAYHGKFHLINLAL